MGTLPPSHTRAKRTARRLSGGVVKMTYADAIPAAASTALAAVRAAAGVIDYPRDGPFAP
ncbi:MAG: hypothetical protein C5B57_06530 [Blastocatellia bacterium]|nr:MAG: hypothetical protein C5B57_06530 [Blastocatellia bacterium]